MTIELPEPKSREAEIWADLLLPTYEVLFPLDRYLARRHTALIVDNLLEKLNAYYKKVQTP